MASGFTFTGVTSLLLELAKPASLLASILALLITFHAAFLGTETDLHQRILNTVGMAAIAGAVSLASGLVFTQGVEARQQAPRSPIREAAKPKSNVLPFRRRASRSTAHLPAPDFGLQGVIESFPMRIFYWATSGMAALFLAAWFIETYCIPLSHLR